MADAPWKDYTEVKARHRRPYETATTDKATGQKALSGTQAGGGSSVGRRTECPAAEMSML